MDAAKVLAALCRLVESPVFSQSPRLRRFLEYTVESTLAGRPEELKEYSIGLSVFDRQESFDPRLDPIVRVEAGRVRQKLARYYESLGRAEKIRIELPKGSYVPQFTHHVARPSGTSPYRLYLKGRHHWNQRTEDGLREAIRLYEQAIELDPGYALAWAGLADAHALLGNYGVIPRSEVIGPALHAARRAVELAPALAESHTSLGHLLATYDWDWQEAEREFELAVDLNPYFATAHHWYAITCLMPQRRLDEARVEIAEAQTLEPCSVSIARDAGIVDWCRRDVAGALQNARRTVELDPGFHEAHWIQGLALEQKGDFNAAAVAFAKGIAIRRTARLEGALGHALGAAGRIGEARAMIDRLASRPGYVSPFDPAIVWLGLGEAGRAFDELDRARAQLCYELVWVRVDPRLDPLRGDTRFESLLA